MTEESSGESKSHDSKAPKPQRGFGRWIAIGIGTGTALGVAMGALGTSLAAGAAAGAMVAALTRRKRPGGTE